MDIFASYYTDVGTVKEINQDSLSVKVVNSPRGKIVFAIVCDGMGGLEHGELASKEVVVAFNNWFAVQFAQMVAENSFSSERVLEQWKEVTEIMNSRLSDYAYQKGMMMGTTVSALLVYKGEFFVYHIGDSRIYKIDDGVKQITHDQTLVAEEIRMGRLTEEQAKIDPRRSILLQCVGASGEIVPQFETGSITEDTTFIMSSDGFVHLISEDELYERFCPEELVTKQLVAENCEEATKLVMQRGERDNITVVAIVLKNVV